MVDGHKIIESVKIEIFLEKIKFIDKNDIEAIDEHAFFRLNIKDRKTFKDKIINEYLLGADPIFVGIQKNEAWVVIYNYNKEQALKIILNIGLNKVLIITFYIINKNNIPRI
ncbi:MAG TPA: hypothetical protein VJI68_00400 [Candidatus Nanoarchaeia archaeon]|nr:hypothetical protein [Candidatus Nanoarchaeia archaeon]